MRVLSSLYSCAQFLALFIANIVFAVGSGQVYKGHYLRGGLIYLYSMSGYICYDMPEEFTFFVSSLVYSLVIIIAITIDAFILEKKEKSRTVSTPLTVVLLCLMFALSEAALNYSNQNCYYLHFSDSVFSEQLHKDDVIFSKTSAPVDLSNSTYVLLYDTETGDDLTYKTETYLSLPQDIKEKYEVRGQPLFVLWSSDRERRGMSLR